MSRRRKQQRPRPHEHSATCSCGSAPVCCPEGWPDGADIEAAMDLDAVAVRLLEGVTTDDVFELMQRMPPQVRQYILRGIGLQSASKVNRGMAGQVLARIRGDEHPSGSSLLHMLTTPFGLVFDTDLTPEEWDALLGGDHVAALSVMADHRSLLSRLTTALRTVPPSLWLLGLVGSITAGTPAAAAALAVLATAEEEARAAHDELVDTHPTIPDVAAVDVEALLPFRRLQAVAPEGSVGDGDIDDHDLMDRLLDEFERDPGALAHELVADADGAPDGVAAADGEASDAGRLLEQLADALDGWDDARARAREIAAALEAGRLWEDSDLASIVDWEQELLVAVDDAMTLLDIDQPTDLSRTGLSELLPRLAAEAGGARQWLTALTALTGPPAVASAVAAVADLARQALDDPTHDKTEALRALHTIVLSGMRRRAGEPVDYAEISAADAVVRQHLPEVVPVLLPANYGDVSTAPPASGVNDSPAVPAPSLAAAADTAPHEPDAPAAGPEAADADGPRSAAQEPSGDASASDTLVKGAGVPDGEASADLQDPAANAHPAATPPSAPAAAPPPSAVAAPLLPSSPAAAAPKAVPAAGEVDDLDALLADGAAVTLSALSGARRRTPGGNRDHAPGAPAPRTSQDTNPGRPAAPIGRTKDGWPPDAAPPGLEAGELRAGTSSPGENIARANNVLPNLLGAGRYGLAADLMEASGRSDASIVARRLVAYATALRLPAGDVASAFARDSQFIDRDELGDDRAGHLLAWAAAARICLLSPSAGPGGVLSTLAPSVASFPALTEVGQAFIEASRSGIVVLPEAASAVGSVAASESAAADLAREAAELLAAATLRPIKYPPANGVYQSWMTSSGPLGKLLALVAEDDPGNAGDIRDDVVSKRGRADRQIDETFAVTRRGGNSHNKIIGGARATLVSRWDEALDIAARWADAAERAADQAARLHAGSWQAVPLNKLRSRLQDARERALEELSGQAGSANDELAAATRVAAALLADAFSACDGVAPSGDEPPLPYVAHGELLASDLELNARTLLPDGGLDTACRAALVDLASRPPTPPGDVYDRRAARGDHDLTLALISGFRPTDARGAQALDRRRTGDVAAAASEVTAEIAALNAAIDAQRMSGGLDDGPWSALSSRVLALNEASRADFGRIRSELQSVKAELEGHRRRKIDAAVARIQARSADSANVAEAADVLVKLARDGQIASAEEYLEQVVAGGQLPADDAKPDHLARFFPKVPDLYAAHPDLTGQLREALTGSLPGAAVAALADAARVGFDELTELRRAAGTRALGAWQALTATGKGNPRVDAPTALRAVLVQAGLDFTDLIVEPGSVQAGRQWVRLTGVTGTGKALVPALGSAMSPDGATLRVLLVRSAPTPATVLEWMSAKPADQTVLALWLVKPLTATDRRAIADAARGRPRPPVLFLDAAALGYLICQAEPRRSTFAEIALPLTALSPFRDTPGDAPPEMFYGRTEEMAAVLDLSGSSVLYGGRQLGKSALLRAAAGKFEASGANRHAVERAIFTVGSEDTDRDPSRLWDALWPRLAQRGIVPESQPDGDLASAVYDHVLAWLDGDPSRALLVLLDEADAFLDADAAGNRFTHVDWCRRIMLDSRRRAKFVFAGLHRTARFESLPNQPLSHLGRPVSVGPLRPQHAYNLLTRPLEAMGFRFADPIALPARVLALANNMPALLQLFGAALVAHLTSRPVGGEGPPYLITGEDIDAVFSDSDLREAFRQKYQLTINLDHRYMVIAYVLAEAAHDRGIDASLSLTELEEACRQAWPAGFGGMAADDFRALVTECVDLGVLADDDGRFRVRTPTVLRLLGTEEHVLDVLYKRTESMSVPSPTDAASYRRRLGQGRSPFTERQLGQLFAPGRRVLVITGSPALGSQSALGALEEARKEARLDYFNRCHTVTPDGIRRDIAKVTGTRSLIVADGTKLSPAALRELLAVADAAVAGNGRPVTVAVLAAPGNAGGWIDWPERLELSRVDAPGLRLWCDEDNLPFRDDPSVAELQRDSGGWPMAVARAAHATNDSPVGSPGRALDELRTWLDGAGGAELATQADVATGVLGDAFRCLSELTQSSGDDPEDLAQLLELDGVDPGSAAGAGFADLLQVVKALRVLGALVPDQSGGLRAEPVLAAAARAAAGPAPAPA